MAQSTRDRGQDPVSDRRSEAGGGGGPYTAVDGSRRLGRTAAVLGAILVAGLVGLLFAVA